MNRAQRIIEKLPPWLLTAVTTAAILWLTLAPRPLGDMKPELFPGADKVVHAIMFGGLLLMIYVDKSRVVNWHPLRVFFTVVAMLAVILFGISIEFIQGSMDVGRSFDIYDILADAAGAVLVAVLWNLFTRLHDGRKQGS